MSGFAHIYINIFSCIYIPPIYQGHYFYSHFSLCPNITFTPAGHGAPLGLGLKRENFHYYIFAKISQKIYLISPCALILHLPLLGILLTWDYRAETKVLVVVFCENIVKTFVKRYFAEKCVHFRFFSLFAVVKKSVFVSTLLGTFANTK
jgi:hypothetical protein